MLMGYFVQIPPVGGGDLYITPKSITSARGLEALEGHKLFHQFKLITLGHQHRARDPIHMEAIAAFRDWSPNGLRAREKFFMTRQLFGQEDRMEDPKWTEALFVSTDRRTVHAINAMRVCHFAKELGFPVLAWRLPLQSKCASRVDAKIQEMLYTHVKDMCAFFCARLPHYNNNELATRTWAIKWDRR